MKTTLKTAGEQTMLYHYDQLNRIKTAVSSQNTYQTGYSYDANGNILSLLRNDGNNATIDNLSYTYNTTVNNRLNKLRDNSGNNTGFTSSPTPFSYQYDKIGNLIEDEEKGVSSVKWTVYGKVESVTKEDTEISYKYDATGNRIYKKVNTTETHYVRDASGNLMATYENEIAKDFVIYGSSRLGVYNGNTSEGKRTLGNKKYELSNQLGNVLSVITDNKIGIDNLNNDLIADYYEPYVVFESDYYPFGMTMKNRSFASSEYRFGFNTQEKSTELGEDSYTTEFWQYDSRNARRWNNDPRPNTSISVYAAFAGNPIWFSDVKGDSVELIIGKGYTKNGKEHPYGHVALRVFNAKEGYDIIYDFGRYGAVHFTQITGDGILNVYTNPKNYLRSEMSLRSSVGYTQVTTIDEDKQIISHFKNLTNSGEVYNGGAVPGGGGTAYKLEKDYNILSNNCLTMACSGVLGIGIDWLGDIYDPREALTEMEGKFESLNMTRTEYNKGGKITVTFKMRELPKETEQSLFLPANDSSENDKPKKEQKIIILNTSDQTQFKEPVIKQ